MPNPTKRKPIQIMLSPLNTIMCLCDDGTIWGLQELHRENTGKEVLPKSFKWEQIPSRGLQHNAKKDEDPV